MSANELLDRYVAVWNEPDAAARRAAVAELWTPEGLHFTQTRRFQGTEDLVARVTEAYDQFVGGQKLRFRSAGNPVGHQGALTFNWLMSPADADTVLAVGFDVVLLDDAGRIVRDYQFNEPPMASPELDEQAERYLASDGAGIEQLRKETADRYLPDARLVDDNGVHDGVDAIAAALAAGGARARAGTASAQHDALRYPWRTESGVTGVDFLLRDERGLIREHRRFTGAGQYPA
ncbi:hypothetical protein A6P39_044450 (plasmid) [Streptomyces sp. FXJ1.172]|uniref:hypothetical protein n=1 Tax=Streptomyces sp. FXJ1.172 TaxID=710705 RepID=UPI0023DD4746|nr:hypothetical protein [Streptomyces sp. FXJ1.172]WEP01072.1 hypothetical protein A6P39_044450 [Streptomyces sp. FXJ1.172]